jgi:hypothetical protein
VLNKSPDTEEESQKWTTIAHSEIETSLIVYFVYICFDMYKGALTEKMKGRAMRGYYTVGAVFTSYL